MRCEQENEDGNGLQHGILKECKASAVPQAQGARAVPPTMGPLPCRGSISGRRLLDIHRQALLNLYCYL